MQAPFLLFIKDSPEVMLFPILKHLESYIETPDVLDGIYEVFDSGGQSFRLTIDNYEFPERSRAKWTLNERGN